MSWKSLIFLKNNVRGKENIMIHIMSSYIYFDTYRYNKKEYLPALHYLINTGRLFIQKKALTLDV